MIDGNTLEGVSATALWTLRNRAAEAKRVDGVIADPWAVMLFDAIDYDYAKFGRPNQAHALRTRSFDAAIGDYLRSNSRASVVALAEGLQTSFQRLRDDGLPDELTWYSVDLPPVIALRERLLPSDDRVVALAQSVLDRTWMDGVNAGHGVVITAEGLLMYLDPDDARSLIADCAARFPGGRMVFDSIPPWLSRRTVQGWRLSDRYVTPPMPFGMTADEGIALATEIPGVCAARDVALPPGRGLFQPWVCRSWDRIGPLRRARPSITLLEFGT